MPHPSPCPIICHFRPSPPGPDHRRKDHVNRLVPVLSLLLLSVPTTVMAQNWADETPTLAGGRVTLGGEVTVTASPEDDGRFNYTDYERNALQLIRVALTAAVRPVERVTLVTELRAEGDTSGGQWTATPYALYVRVRPWRDRPVDFQAGRIPPVFGVAGRRAYANDNVLIGYPLIWQYLTILRPDAVPANADELIYARNAGWQSWYSVGASNYERGVPLATAFRYDTGVEARIGDELSRLSVATALTAGTLSSPGTGDRSGGPQLSARVAVRPTMGLVIGGSFADGDFLSNAAERDLPSYSRGERYAQQSWGLDAEYSRDHWLIRAETIAVRWALPYLDDPPIDEPIMSAGISVEGRYRVAPGVTLGARVDHIGFSELTGSHETLPWDAPVSRVEGGIAWTIARHVTARFSVQYNHRQRGQVTSSTLPAAQVSLWF